jgi:hypothetical protein
VIDADGRLHYVVSSPKSSLTFEARSTLHTVRGKATGLSGQVACRVTPDGKIVTEPAPKMHVEFPVENLKTSNLLQDREVWKLIGNTGYACIAADLRELRPAGGPNQYDAAGDITLAGRARRYNGKLNIDDDGERLTIDGDLSVDIRDFGLRPPSLLVLRVDPLVKVRLWLVAARAA